jgi:ubiquitin C-terminal hydrolase
MGMKLLNVGNICYLNSSLKLLFSIEPFIEYMLNKNNSENSTTQLFNQLLRKEIDIDEFVEFLEKKWKIVLRKQRDPIVSNNIIL